MGTIVIVGASLAGLRTGEALRAEGFAGELVIVGDESRAPYDRPPLSKEVLAGTWEPERIALRQSEGLDADWRLGQPAVALDPKARRVGLADGTEVGFDGLVVATGTRPRRLAAVDPSRPGVHELRTLDDAVALRRDLVAGARVVVVGAGFIGVEVASTARALGLEVAMVSPEPPLAAAGALAVAHATHLLTEADVALHLGRVVASVAGTGRPVAVVLDDGTRLPADVVVSAVGVTPATGWLEGSGLPLDNGLVCEATLAVVAAERVVAAGDVARWPNSRCGGASMRIEHWTNATEHARAAARTLLRGDGAEPHRSLPLFWSDHFGGRLQSVGLPGLADRFEDVEGTVEGNGRFAARAYRGDRLIGGLTWGRPRTLIALRAELPDPLWVPGASPG